MEILKSGPCFLSVLAFLLIVEFQSQTVEAENILVVMMFGSKSHKTAFDPLLEELAARGHQITILSIYKPGKPVPNITEIEAFDYDELVRKIPNPYDLRLQGKSMVAFSLTEISTKICRAFYENPEVREILKRKFDLILVNAFLADCSYGFVHHFQSKFILIRLKIGYIFSEICNK